jgi:hypothetical protein
MKLYEYSDYEEYKKTQTDGNVRKLEHVWVNQETIAFISTYLSNKLGLVESGLCHGTRRGLEQKWFSEYLNAEVIGTDISSTATQFPNTIEWDFHEVKDEWLGRFDFVYSNALDHAYDPEKALRAWMSCLNPCGHLILQWTRGHKISSKLDPFGATLGEYIDMIYNMHINIHEVKRLPEPQEGTKQGWIIVLTNDNKGYKY